MGLRFLISNTLVCSARGRMCINGLMKHLPQQISGKLQRLVLWEHAGDTDDDHHHDAHTDTDQHDDGVVYYFSLLPISFPVDSKTNYVLDDTWSSFIHLWWICPWWRQCQYCLVRIFIIGDKGVWGVMGRVEPEISDIHCTAGQGQSQCLLGPIKWVTKTQQNTWVLIVVILIKPLQYFHSNEKKTVTS